MQSVLRHYARRYWLLCLGIFALLCTFFIVYRPTLFNFLIADDFFYMQWLQAANHCHKMLWESFYIPLAPTDPRNVVFYRPLFTAILFLESQIYGLHPVCTRAVSMLVELLSGVMLGAIVLKLKNATSSITRVQALTWTFLAAALFVLYPLHSEPVNWIAARMDPLVTLFTLLSLYCYIKKYGHHSKLFYFLSILSAVCAFLTKEMAVALPSIIFTYDLLLRQNATNYDYGRRANKALKSTWIYWFILILYFVLRKLLLGEFIGGYHHVQVSDAFPLGRWLYGLFMIFVPANPLIFKSHNPAFAIWSAIVISLSALSFIAFTIKDRKDINVLSFLLFWFLVSLAPLYKVFPYMMSCATGSRIAYLATAPLCIFLAYGIAVFSSGNKLVRIPRLLGLSSLICWSYILYTNNLAWAEAGSTTNNIVLSIKTHCRNLSGISNYIVGVPVVTDKGIFLGPLSWMIRNPILDPNSFNCVPIEDNSLVSPFFLKNAIANHQIPANVLYWDSSTSDLKPMLFTGGSIEKKEWKGDELKAIIDLSKSSSHIKAKWLDNGILELESNSKQLKYAVLDFKLSNLPCWKIDLFALQFQRQAQVATKPLYALLQFKNTIDKDYSIPPVLSSKFSGNTNLDQTIYFFMSKSPDWSMGGTCQNIRFLIPVENVIQIKKLTIPALRQFVPDIHIPIIYGDCPGQLKLWGKTNICRNIQYNARSIAGANHVLLEATQSAPKYDELAHSHNIGNTYTYRKQTKGVEGNFTLNKSDFSPEVSIYQAHVKALDRFENEVGLPSDDFFIITSN